MNQELTIAIIGLSSATLGIVAGGFISYFSSKSIKVIEHTHNVIRDEVNQRNIIYSEFLKEANILMLRSIKHKVNSILEFGNITAIFAQIELTSNEEIIKTAQEILSYLTEAHLQNNSLKSDNVIFPTLRKKFISQAKKEIQTIRNG